MSELINCPDCGCVLADPAEQSDAARRRFFAIMRDAFANLPENWRPLIASAEHLRKWILCRVGYCDVSVTDCGTKAAAARVAAMVRQIDSFAVVEIRGALVTVMVARSMRKRMCPKKVFMPLSERAYAYLNEMTGYDVEASEFREAA